MFLDPNIYNESDDWFAVRYYYQKEVRKDIEKLHQVAKKIRKDRISLTRATISFKYFITNMTIEKAFQANIEANRDLLLRVH